MDRFAWLFAVLLFAVGASLMYIACQMDPLEEVKISPEVHLLHRPMQEIDIQGHQDFAPRRPCPAVYDAPNGELRECL